MTHFNTSLRLPVRTGPSAMEDAIVQQVEWYMGRLNLEKDEYLKGQMDEELWVSLDVILNFPKMQRMGVQDKRRVATLLHARSTIVEVDEKAARIRPAWARRSTIIIHDVPANARLDQVASLLHIPSNAELSNAPVPPTVSHPPGLISIQPAADTIWLAIFDSPTGAQDTVHFLLDKEINGQKVNPEVHVENALRSQADSFRQPDGQPQQNVYTSPRPVDTQQPNSAPYAQVSPVMSAGMMTNQMLNPIGMPMPVMPHPTQEAHAQYTYGPTATYAPGYPPQNMAVPRQFMGAPRGMHTGYVMTYPQAGHPYDPSHAVPMQAHPIRAQQQHQHQQVDQNGAPILATTPISAEGATTSQGAQTVPGVPNGGTPAPVPGETVEGAETGAEYAQDAGISQVQADAQRIAAQIPFTAAVQIPVIPGQPIDGQMMIGGQVKPVDMHYMHRAQIMGDPNVYGRGNGRQQGPGRDRNSQRNADGSVRAAGRGSMMDGQRGGSSMHRKGKKGNRGNTRHGHGHDRDRRDGKGDGSSSDSGNRDDRRYDKSKPEPNLASMHFPPLPMSENAGPRAAPPKMVKKDEADDKAEPTASPAEAKESMPNGSDVSPATDEAKTEPTHNEGETGAPSAPTPPAMDAPEKDSSTEELTEPKELKEPIAGVDVDQIEICNQEAVESKEDSPVGEGEKKSEPKAPSTPASSPMSYAAILRSKKPGPLPRPAPPPVSRSSSGASGKNGDSNSGSEATSSTPHPPKEKSGRRRKSNNQRNNHTGDTKDGNAASAGNKNDKNVEKQLKEPTAPTEPKEPNTGGNENVRSKPVVENTRAHPVWVNKPKSLFQAASAAPTVRPSTPQMPIDSKKVSSPVSSQGDEKEASSEKATKETADRSAPNGQPNGTLSTVTAREESNDVNTNGAMETKDVPEVSTSKVVNTTSKTSGDGTKSGKGSNGADKTSSVPAKGAWAAGGPKPWPKNTGNGVVEKVNNTTES